MKSQFRQHSLAIFTLGFALAAFINSSPSFGARAQLSSSPSYAPTWNCDPTNAKCLVTATCTGPASTCCPSGTEKSKRGMGAPVTAGAQECLKTDKVILNQLLAPIVAQITEAKNQAALAVNSIATLAANANSASTAASQAATNAASAASTTQNAKADSDAADLAKQTASNAARNVSDKVNEAQNAKNSMQNVKLDYSDLDSAKLALAQIKSFSGIIDRAATEAKSAATTAATAATTAANSATNASTKANSASSEAVELIKTLKKQGALALTSVAASANAAKLSAANAANYATAATNSAKLCADAKSDETSAANSSASAAAASTSAQIAHSDANIKGISLANIQEIASSVQDATNLKNSIAQASIDAKFYATTAANAEASASISAAAAKVKVEKKKKADFEALNFTRGWDFNKRCSGPTFDIGKYELCATCGNNKQVWGRTCVTLRDIPSKILNFDGKLSPSY